MYDRPNCVCENIRTLCGRPARLSSIGIVICFSTSSAARPSYSVTTLTWMSETSGNASIGSDSNAKTPPAMKSNVISSMNNG